MIYSMGRRQTKLAVKPGGLLQQEAGFDHHWRSRCFRHQQRSVLGHLKVMCGVYRRID